jgi:hypothetical protein
MQKTTRLVFGLILSLTIGLAITELSVNVVYGQRRTQQRTLRPRRVFLVPNNTLVEARLDRQLRAQDVRAGERFTATVTSPDQYNGAVIEGRISQARRSGRIRGRSSLTLVFDRIRHEGRVYNFAGTITDVRRPDGSRVAVDDEGGVREGSQTNRTVRRTAIGAGVGAIIGGIAGGGSGAAIGAGVGGGAGAGSVLLQGRRNLNLEEGSQLTIRSGAPR